MTDIETLIASAETRASCKLGMPVARTHFTVHLDPQDAAALGLSDPEINLHIGLLRGTVDVIYETSDADGGGYREISDEPVEPEAQALNVYNARQNPVATALALIRREIERRAA